MMPLYLFTKWFGTFLCNETSIQKEILFPKDAKAIVKRLIEIQKNTILEEEKKLVNDSIVIVNEKRLQPLGTYDMENPVFKTILVSPLVFSTFLTGLNRIFLKDFNLTSWG